MKLEQAVIDEIKNLCRYTRFSGTANYIQHGTTSVYRHSVAVACVSLRIAEKLNLRVDKRTLIRGALLHDYFLYDWHSNPSVSWHGYRHPRIALENAEKDVFLNKKEKNMILRHMFPLTPVPPVHKEGWIICLADKLCSVRETLLRKKRRSDYKKIAKKKTAETV